MKCIRQSSIPLGQRFIQSAISAVIEKKGNTASIRLKDAEKKSYKKLFFVNDDIVGLILIGDISESQKLITAIKNGASYKDTGQLEPGV